MKNNRVIETRRGGRNHQITRPGSTRIRQRSTGNPRSRQRLRPANPHRDAVCERRLGDRRRTTAPERHIEGRIPRRKTPPNANHTAINRRPTRTRRSPRHPSSSLRRPGPIRIRKRRRRRRPLREILNTVSLSTRGRHRRQTIRTRDHVSHVWGWRRHYRRRRHERQARNNQCRHRECDENATVHASPQRTARKRCDAYGPAPGTLRVGIQECFPAEHVSDSRFLCEVQNFTNAPRTRELRRCLYALGETRVSAVESAEWGVSNHASAAASSEIGNDPETRH